MFRSLALCSLLLVSISAEECLRFPTVVNLNLQQQMGNWGIHGFFGDADYRDPTLQCYHVELSADQFSKEPVSIKAASAGTNTTTGAAVNEQFDLQVKYLAIPGSWTTNIFGVDYAVSVLHTDYVQYSLLVRCGIVGGKPEYLYMLLSRGHDQMPQNIVDGYKNFVEKELGGTVAKYYQVAHSHMLCH